MRARASLLACILCAPLLCVAQPQPASPPADSPQSGSPQGPLEAIKGLLDRVFSPGRPDAPRAAPPAGSAATAPASSVNVEADAKPPEPAPAARVNPVVPEGPATTSPAAPAQAPTETAPPAMTSPAAPRVRTGIALLLPAKSSAFGRAGEIARLGFMAARGVASDKPEVMVIDTDGTAQGAAAAYEQALAKYVAVIVGPLTKVEVGGLMALRMEVPTLTLNTPDGDAKLPANLFALSLNVEGEAHAAAAATFSATASTAVVVTTTSPLARRAAGAFQDAWIKLGGSMKEAVEFTGSLSRVRQSVERARADVVFLAADAERARLLRPYLGRNATVVGTSQVFAGAQKGGANKAHDLNGLRFVDMPWLHQPDHAAAMVYPRPESALSADLDRLYALGIDAFRVAQEMTKARTDFEIDGVTGNLQVHHGVIGRAPLMVEFRDGKVAPVRAGR